MGLDRRWGCEVPTELVCETWLGGQREIDACLSTRHSAAGSACPCTSWGQKCWPRMALQGWGKPPRTAGSSVKLASAQQAGAKGPHREARPLGCSALLGCLSSTAKSEPLQSHICPILGTVPWPNLDGVERSCSDDREHPTKLAQ